MKPAFMIDEVVAVLFDLFQTYIRYVRNASENDMMESESLGDVEKQICELATLLLYSLDTNTFQTR